MSCLRPSGGGHQFCSFLGVWGKLLRVLAAAVGGLLIVVPADAQYFGRNKVQYDDFDFQILETEHFKVYYYPEAERAVQDAARMLERWYDRHSQVFVHQFEEKKPIILYANDADFQQTNVTESTIGPGTGGFTESIRERVVMPLTGIYGETDHVLGHELVHSFQYDLALNGKSPMDLREVPLWLVEGMAEYLTLGRHDSHTAMWMRDAALRDDLPTIEEMANSSEYFPYRYGQALLAYVGGKYGDQAVTDLYKMSGRVGVDTAIVRNFGISADSLSAEWAKAIEEAYLPLAEDRTPVDSAGKRVLARDIDAGDINVAPTLSPDGRYVAFLSERNLFEITLFVADAQTGEVITSLGSVGTTQDLDAIRFIDSAGTWDPSGQRLAFVSFAEGDNEISIWNLKTDQIEQSFSVNGVTAIKNPAWSPDGSKLAFSGMDGGISDLYVLDLETKEVRQLTNDRFADLQPTWSPDGRMLAFTTDRDRTDFRGLRTTTSMHLATISLDSGQVQTLEPFPGAHHHNPQFAPDGRSLYFISDQDGLKDVYRYAVSDGQRYRVTELQTGVSGITALSPAMSVARQSGELMFSAYVDGSYVGLRRMAANAQGTPVEIDGDREPKMSVSRDSLVTSQDTTASDSLVVSQLISFQKAATLPPFSAVGEGLMDRVPSDTSAGLSSTEDWSTKDYRSELSLESVYQPSVGVSVGGPFGTAVGGSVGVRYGDMLGNQQLDVLLQANGTLKDIGGGVAYQNRGDRFNYGVSLSHTPYVIGQSVLTSQQGYNLVTERLYHTQALASGSYPISTTRRIEVGVGATRYGFGISVNGPDEGQIRETYPFQTYDNEHFAQTSLAYVVDYTDFGYTAPMRGARYRLQVSPYFGTTTFVNTLADLRRYFYAQPFTFAVHGYFSGNYGAREDDIFGEEYLGYAYSESFIRGYSFSSYESTADCVSADCNADFNRLRGTHVAKVSTELRLPLLGQRPLSLVDFSYLPTDLALFADAGVAWRMDDPFQLTLSRTSTDRIPVMSTGVAMRFNLFGALILEPYWTYAWQRPAEPGQWGLRFTAGW